MNENDISRCSYKELQALAVKYRVPGNIKKELLIKILRAARSRDDGEVDRLLHALKQTRKRRSRKNKIEKLSITSTPIQSPDNVMTDDYYHSQQRQQQQQSPYQWVGAEEEIVSREDDKIPHYEEFRQFLLQKIQKEFQTYNTSQNSRHDSTIMDLRTTASSSMTRSFPLDIVNCSKPNLVAINESNSCIYPLANHVQYHHLQKDSSKSTCGSILLKKMLQAPVGTNLGELAAPVFGDYRVWSVKQYHSEDILDNSDTLTANSEDNENEDNLVINTECYGVLNNVRDEYLLNDANFVKNVQDIDQMSNVLSDQNNNQYRYSYANNDVRQNYQTWTIANVMDPINDNCIDTDISTSKVLHSIYLDNAMSNAGNDNTNYRYHIAENIYNANQNILNINSSEDPIYYSSNIMSNVQSTPISQPYMENHNKNVNEARGYFQTIGAATDTNFTQDVPVLNQAFSNNMQCNPEAYQYSHSHENQRSYVAMSQSLESQESNSVVTSQDTNACKGSISEKVPSYSDGILSPFWPKWSYRKLSENNLENILNFNMSKTIDYTKIDQTSCIYCYTAPIVTHKAVLSTDVCSQKIKLVAEQRHHSFSPYWLLYNDSSAGMRMANVQSNADECNEEQVWMIHGASMSDNNNMNVKDSIDESEDSINDVWMNDYSKYRTPLQKDVNSCESITTEVPDSLFSTIRTESNIRNDTITTSPVQEDISY